MGTAGSCTVLYSTRFSDGYFSVLGGSSIASLQSCMYSIERELEQTGRLLTALLKEHEQLDISYARSFNAHRPIHQLPDEVLSLIFIHVGPLPIEPIEENPSVMRTCHLWRRIAIGTPQLWSTIDTIWDVTNGAKKLSLWLQRSRTLPIDLDFTFPPMDHTQEVALQMEALFKSAFPRCRTLSLRISSISLFKMICSISTRYLSAQKLLVDASALEEQLSGTFTLVRSPSKSITQLEIVSPSIDLRCGEGIKYSTLKKLRVVTGAPLNYFAHILTFCTNLQHLHINCDNNVPIDHDGSKIELVHLLSLHIQSFAVNLLQYIHAPDLESLSIYTDQYSDIPLLIQPVPTSISFPRLLFLKLNVSKIDPEHVINFLPQFTMLQHLSLSCCDHMGSVVLALELTSVTSSEAVFPALRTLRIIPRNLFSDNVSQPLWSIISALRLCIERDGDNVNQNFKFWFAECGYSKQWAELTKEFMSDHPGVVRIGGDDDDLDRFYSADVRP